MLQVEVCFLRLPPGFPAVPQYFNHTPVGPSPSQVGSRNGAVLSEPVSIPRLVKRSMRISRTTLSLLTSSKGLCDLSNWQRFQTLSRTYSTCSCRISLHLQIYLPSQVLQTMDVFIIPSLPPRVVGRLLTAGLLCSPDVTPVHHSYKPLRHPLAFRFTSRCLRL